MSQKTDVLMTGWGNYSLFSLRNNKASQVDISDLGALIVNFKVMDSGEQLRNIVLGYDTPQEYLNGNVYLGCVVGPWANRIDGGKFELDGKTFQLEQNEGMNHLHGASANIGAKRWSVVSTSKDSITLSTTTEENEAGYPHQIDFSVTYQLTNDDELIIDYQAKSGGKTPINITQHTYFNLDESDDVLSHQIKITSDKYLEVNDSAIPLGEKSVSDTPLDLREFTRISDNIHRSFPQLDMAGGFDHCWCFPNTDMKHNATVLSSDAQMKLEVFSDQIGIQFYSGNFLDNEKGRNNTFYKKHAGFCLETQCYPNQVNMKSANQCIYGSGDEYKHRVIFKVTNQ